LRQYRETHDRSLKISRVIALLRKELRVDYAALWQNRDPVMHNDRVLRDEDAKMVVNGVQRFSKGNQGKFGLQ